MDNLKALIYIVVITAFIIILIRKKALPFLKKKEKSGSAGFSVPAEKAEAFPRSGKELRYEVLAFGTYNRPDPKDFGNQIEARLECELTRLANKQVFYKVDYVPLGNMLLLFISYEA